MRVSATSDWSKLIVKGFRDKIKEREIYVMDVPQTGGGYIHNYFCPVHNLQFAFEWNNPHAHYCGVCKINGSVNFNINTWISIK